MDEYKMESTIVDVFQAGIEVTIFFEHRLRGYTPFDGMSGMCKCMAIINHCATPAGVFYVFKK
jgi:hypothetical protein